MPEFRPNPFKVKWEELIVKKIVEETEEKYSLYPLRHIATFIITRYKEEMEKQKGIKE